MGSKSWKQQPMKSLKNPSKVVKRSFSRAHTQTVGIRLSTKRAVFIISVQSTAEFMVMIRLSYSAAALRTVDVHSTQAPLSHSTRNALMDLCPCPMLILLNILLFVMLQHSLVWDLSYLVS